MSDNNESRKVRQSTHVFTSRHPAWLDEPVPENCDENDLSKIILFFVFYSPCTGQSQRQKPLSSYGWYADPWFDHEYLKRKIDKIIFGKEESKLHVVKKTDFNEKIKGKDFGENFHLNHTLKSHQRFFITQVYPKKEYMSLFHHIRNSLAHGRLAMYNVDDDDIMFVMEDGENVGTKANDKFEVTARIVVLKSTLLKIIDLLVHGAKTENRDLPSDIITAIRNGYNTPEKIRKAFGIDSKEWSSISHKLKKDGKIYRNKETGKWNVKNP